MMKQKHPNDSERKEIGSHGFTESQQKLMSSDEDENDASEKANMQRQHDASEADALSLFGDLFLILTFLLLLQYCYYNTDITFIAILALSTLQYIHYITIITFRTLQYLHSVHYNVYIVHIKTLTLTTLQSLLMLQSFFICFYF